MKFICGSTFVLFTLLFLSSTPSQATNLTSFLNELSFSTSIQFGGYSYDSYRRRGDDDDDHYSHDDDDHYNSDDDDHYGHNDDDDRYSHDDDDDGNDIPLDGGLSFLAVAGAGLGIKKVVEHRNKKKESNK